MQLAEEVWLLKDTCWKHITGNMKRQWVWLDIVAAVDTMLQEVGLHLMLCCTQFDLHKQIASSKSYPIEAAEDKMLVAVEVKRRSSL